GGGGVGGVGGWDRGACLSEARRSTRPTMARAPNLASAPSSVSLARNSRRSQIVDLASADLEPAGWDALVKPPLPAPEDIALYELHVRDFSASDLTVPEPLRGTFRAFTVPSDCPRHPPPLAQ